MNRQRWRSVLRGSEDGINAASAVLAVAVAAGLGHVLTWEPGLRGPAFELGLFPSLLEEWAMVGAFVLLAATIVVLGGGWLACWWFPFPSFFVSYLHYFAVGSGTFVVGVGLPDVVVLAGLAAGVCGTAGYLLGVAGR